MRLIMDVHNTTECGFSEECECLDTFPIIHESPDAAIDELRQLVVEQGRSNPHGWIRFGGNVLFCETLITRTEKGDWVFNPPHIYTLDEFFEGVEGKQPVDL